MAQIEAHRPPEHRVRPGPSPVPPKYTLLHRLLDEPQVLKLLVPPPPGRRQRLHTRRSRPLVPVHAARIAQERVPKPRSSRGITLREPRMPQREGRAFQLGEEGIAAGDDVLRRRHVLHQGQMNRRQPRRPHRLPIDLTPADHKHPLDLVRLFLARHERQRRVQGRLPHDRVVRVVRTVRDVRDVRTVRDVVVIVVIVVIVVSALPAQDDVQPARQRPKLGGNRLPGLPAHDDDVLLGRILDRARDLLEIRHIPRKLPRKPPVCGCRCRERSSCVNLKLRTIQRLVVIRPPRTFADRQTAARRSRSHDDLKQGRLSRRNCHSSFEFVCLFVHLVTEEKGVN